MKRLTTLARMVALTLSVAVLAPAASAAMNAQDALKTLLGDAAPQVEQPPLPDQAPAQAASASQTTASGGWPFAQKDTGRIVAAAPTTGMNDGHRTEMVVPGGATLAALLAPTARRSGIPLKQLYQPFVALNPHAFVRGNVNRLMAGARVRMFNDADLAALASGRSGSVHSGSSDDRRNWVRFP
jgi:hypothetical protein